MKCLIHGLRLFFASIFLGLFVKSIIKVARPGVGTRVYVRQGSTFPSLTMCPFIYNPIANITTKSNKENITWHYLNSLPTLRDEIDAVVKDSGTYVDINTRMKEIILSEPYAVINNVNTSTDQFWQDFYWIMPIPPFSIVKCTSLEIPAELGPTNFMVSLILHSECTAKGVHA